MFVHIHKGLTLNRTENASVCLGCQGLTRGRAAVAMEGLKKPGCSSCYGNTTSAPQSMICTTRTPLSFIKRRHLEIKWK